jgi:ribosomal protein S12 methylthiotransferase accessory factor
MPEPLSSLLLPGAANNRHGLVFSPQVAQLSKSDVQDIFHVGVPFSATNTWKSASGGVSINRDDAVLAAVGEGVERYCAAIVEAPVKKKKDVPKHKLLDAEKWTLFSESQRQQKGFPFTNLYSDNCLYTNVFDLVTNNVFWVPHPLVVLRDDFETGVPTSSGLAAGPSVKYALLRALQELIERDALMTMWLHSLPGRAIKLPDKYLEKVKNLHGEVYAFDFTPAYSLFPVVAIAGGIPKRGKWRYSLGVACRETFDQALDKAFLEWCQGVFFAGVYPHYVETNRLNKPSDVKSFDDHAIYYTQNPDEWQSLPLFRNKNKTTRPVMAAHGASLEKAVQKLNKAGLRLFYRDLTTVDGLQAGVRVVRVLSPDLIPINSHHDWPFIGGTAENVKLRFPWSSHHTQFPSSHPHPLG